MARKYKPADQPLWAGLQLSAESPSYRPNAPSSPEGLVCGLSLKTHTSFV
jgi:hypothetical protein